eukprot:scaffold78340_cov59-Cyclotella_meneghiniana.AAC.2
MLGEYSGIREDEGCVTVIIGSSSGLVRRGDFLVTGMLLSGLIMAGSWPGVLARVTRWWIRGAAFTVRGSVGLLLVVTCGASFTL